MDDTAKAVTAIESAIFGMDPGDTAVDVQDILDMKLLHLEAMLTITCGCGGKSFRSWSAEVQDDYMSACTTLAGECRRLSGLLAGMP